MGYSRKKKQTRVEGGLKHPAPPLPAPPPHPAEFLVFFSLLETPQNFLITPLGDFRV